MRIGWMLGLLVANLLLMACHHVDETRKPVAADPLTALEALIEREPRHVGAFYIAARTAARSGDSVRALAYLSRLADIGLGDALEPEDFPGLGDSDDFQAMAKRFMAAAPAVGHASLWTEARCADLLPEGTAWDPRRSELLVSSGRLRTVIAVKSDGACRELVPQADGGLLAVLGMAVDAEHDTLWVATTAAPFMRDAATVPAGSSMLARIDLAHGRVAATFPLRGGGMLNDLTLAANGDVYVTDSSNGVVLRLAANTSGLIPIVPNATFEGPNGIAALRDGTLVVADFHALWRIRNPAGVAPQIQRLAAPDGAYLGGFDGLTSVGNNVIGIQNLVGRGRVWQLTLDPVDTHLIPTLLLRGHPDLMNPTTGAQVSDQFLFVADPNLQKAIKGDEVSPLPAGRSGHRVLALPLH